MSDSSLWVTAPVLEGELLATLKNNLSPALDSLPEGWLEQFEQAWLPVATWLAAKVKQSEQVPVVGVHGGQGSGKSTLSKALAALYKQALGWNCVIVSIDDLYLSHADRQSLAASQHPLLATRGVPGTHDWQLGMALFDQLKQLKEGESLKIPAFDKVSDDRLPEDQWHQITGPVDLVLFEGWCVGTQAASEDSLQKPINELEEKEDVDGSWRTWVNHQLKEPYKDWFAQINWLIMLKVPGMDAVLNWRGQQEVENKKATKGSSDRSLDEAGLKRFIQHYERLTENALTQLPEVADLVLELNSAHKVDKISYRDDPSPEAT